MVLLIIGIISAVVVAALQIWKVYEPDGTVGANRLQVAAVLIAACTAVITMVASHGEDNKKAASQIALKDQLSRMELALAEVNRKIGSGNKEEQALITSRNELQAGIRELKADAINLPAEIKSEEIDVAILVGHNKKRPGNIFVMGEENLSEFEYFSILAPMIEKELSKNGIKTRVFNKGDESRAKTYARINAALPDYIIELHANAWINESLRGVEGFVKTNDMKAQELAMSITKSVSKVLGTKDRGVKEGVDRIEAVLSMASAPAVLLEAFFITNPQDVKNAIDKRSELSQAVATAIENQVKG